MAEEEDVLARFGGRLRVLRVGRKLSQEALALECDLDRAYGSGIERGRRNVSLRNIAALARVLNVSLSGAVRRRRGKPARVKCLRRVSLDPSVPSLERATATTSSFPRGTPRPPWRAATCPALRR